MSESIQSIFFDVLSRAASDDEANLYLASLQEGNSLDQIRQQVAFSNEASSQLQSIYQQVLGRSASQQELQTQESGLAGGLTLAQERENISTSGEAINAITAIYSNVVATTPTADELQTRENQLNYGGSLAAISAELGGSSPATYAALVQLRVSERYWNGDARYTLSIDGLQVGGVYTAHASYITGQSEVVDIDTRLSAGQHTITVNYLNDAFGGTEDTDRDLFIDGTTVNGKLYSYLANGLPYRGTAALLTNGQVSYQVILDPTVAYTGLPPTFVLPTVDTLCIKVAEDAGDADAQFTVTIDGHVTGEVYTAYASNDEQNSYSIITQEILGAGNHQITIAFLNGGGPGDPGTASALHILSATTGLLPLRGFPAVLSAGEQKTITFALPKYSEAVNFGSFVTSAYQDVTNGVLDTTRVVAAQDAQRAGGSTVGDLRTQFATSPEAAMEIDAIYRQVLDRGATASEIGRQQDVLSSGGSLQLVRTNVAFSTEVSSELSYVTGSSYVSPLSAAEMQAYQSKLSQGASAQDIRSAISKGDLVGSAINASYNSAVDRAATDAELSYWRNQVAGGLSVSEAEATISTYTGYTVSSPDGNQISNLDLRENLNGDPALDIVNGYSQAFQKVSLQAMDGSLMASGSARDILAILPVLVTMNGGLVPTLLLPSGVSVPFSDAMQLAGYLFRTGLHADSVDPLLQASFAKTQGWINQVDQPALQSAVHFGMLARADTAAGDATQAQLHNVAASLLLQLAGEDPGSRGNSISSRMQVDGKDTIITAYTDGGVDFHSIDHGISGIVEAVVAIVADVLAVVQPEIGIPLAVAVHLAEAGQAFADGNVIGGILNVAGAASAGLAYVGDEFAAQVISTAARSVGGVTEIVNGAENGDFAALLGGVLLTAGAVASGLDAAQVAGGTVAAATQYTSLVSTLTAAGALTSFGSSLSHGDIEGALVNSLLPWLASAITDNITNQNLSTRDLMQNPVPTVSDMSVQPIDITGKAVAFVGGFFDQTAGGDSLIKGASDQFANSAAGQSTSTRFFSWDQPNDLATWLAQQDQPVVIISHSYGADTASTVVAQGHPVDTLVLLDPVSQVRPDFTNVVANTQHFLDFNAVGNNGQAVDAPNLIADIGGKWNYAALGYADLFQNVNLDHGNIGSANFVNHLIGQQ